MPESINFSDKFKLFSEYWSPRVVAEMNDYQFKLVKLKGEFVWHSHAITDEAFIVIDGEMTILFRDGRVDLSAGEMYIVPRGVEHKPVAEKGCQLMLIEPKGTVNTEGVESDLTAENDVWV